MFGIITIQQSCGKKIIDLALDKPPTMDYEKHWAQVDSLIKVKLPESALEVVTSIYKSSRVDDNNIQFLKSIIYKGKLLNDLQEDGTENLLIHLEKEIADAFYPSKQILQSILAQFYFRFAQRSSSRFANRTDIMFEDPDDVKTWSMKTLLKRSLNLTDAAISVSGSAKTTIL